MQLQLQIIIQTDINQCLHPSIFNSSVCIQCVWERFNGSAAHARPHLQDKLACLDRVHNSSGGLHLKSVFKSINMSVRVSPPVGVVSYLSHVYLRFQTKAANGDMQCVWHTCQTQCRCCVWAHAHTSHSAPCVLFVEGTWDGSLVLCSLLLKYRPESEWERERAQACRRAGRLVTGGGGGGGGGGGPHW